MGNSVTNIGVPSLVSGRSMGCATRASRITSPSLLNRICSRWRVGRIAGHRRAVCGAVFHHEQHAHGDYMIGAL